MGDFVCVCVKEQRFKSLRSFHVVESLYMVLTTDECVIRDTSAKFSIFWFHIEIIIFTEETSELVLVQQILYVQTKMRSNI